MFKRGKIWYFSINGAKESSGTSDRRRAEALERKRKQEEWDKAHGFYVKTWDEACLSWLEKNKHLDSYVWQCIKAKWWTPHLTGLKLNQITADLVHQIIQRERPVDMSGKTPANATANVYVKFVAKIIRSADVIPPKFHAYKPPQRSKRWLKPEEWKQLEAVMPDDLRHICTFALATGLREENDMRFEWGWLHGDKAYLSLELTKTNEDYGIPLNTVAQRIIEERRQATVRHPKLVFTNAGKPWQCWMVLRELYKAVKKAEIERINFHTFRHTFASWLAQRGVSDSVRKRLGCWEMGGDAASGYVHFDVESLRPFAEAIVPFLDTGKTQAVERKAETG